jgi:thiamine kinase-like enzyme
MFLTSFETFHAITCFCSQILREKRIFEREINTYTLILPSLHRLLRHSSLENYQPLSANLLYTLSDLPQQVIVLQDLKAQSFRMADKTRGLDLKHSLLVMKQIGRYHGASAVLQQKTPENVLYFREGLYGSKVFETSEDFFRNGATDLANEVAKWPQYGQRFSEKLLKLADNAYTKFLESLTRREEEFNVLCHGDLRLNNVMFRYSTETGEVTDIR